MQKQKGITLIALIITVILLLILLGTSLGIVLRGDFFGKARKTAKMTDEKISSEGKTIEKGQNEWEQMEVDICSHIWGEERTILEPTCTTPGKKSKKCENCGKTIEIETPALGHIWGEERTILEPTCTTPGKKSKKCENCGKTIEVETPALGHNYENRVCTRCGDTIPLQPGDKAVENEEYNGATIPKGFTISKIPGETTVDEGLVIYDIPEGTTPDWTNPDSVKTKYNQFVWIPVEVKSTDKENSIASFYRSKWTANASTGGERTTGLSTSFTEPDSTNDTADKTGIANQIANLTKSIYKYGGFYIGRYEAGSETERTSSSGVTTLGIKQDMYPYNYVKWGDSMSSIGTTGAVYLSNSLYNTNEYGATSMLCTGACWDSMLDFIKDSEHSVTDSTKWGNYKNSETFEITRGSYAVYNAMNNTLVGNFQDVVNEYPKEKDKSILLTTGATERNSSKNIYDVAGNCWEWTTESSSTGLRVDRGRWLQRQGFFPFSE